MKDKAAFALVLIFTVIVVVALAGGCVKKQGDNNSFRRLVKNVTTIVDKQAKTVDWSHENNKIAFGRWGMDGYVDVFVMNPDGSDKECLTCDRPGCPQKHNGNPAWHPSGDYIVFTAEKEDNPVEYSKWAVPGGGFNCDLWVMTSNGEEFYQLTDYPLHMKGVIHPHFSYDGNKLLWAERLGKAGGSSWGEWALKVADFVIGTDGPRLRDIKTYQPGKQRYFYESHAFSIGDNKILFCGNPDDQSDVGFDIYEMDLRTQELTNLTSSPDDWDEHAQYSPDGKKIAWMSSTGFNIDFKSIEGWDWMKYLTTELWIMDADGSNKQRLTYFNEPGYPEYMGGRRCVVSDISWSPDGKKVIALVAYEGREFARLKAKLVIVEVEPLGEEPVRCDIGYELKGVTPIKENGGRLDWSHRSDLIAFDKEGKDGFFDLYTMKPDGSDEVCLTCNRVGLPRRHMGQPAWHPSGEYIVFQAEESGYTGYSVLASPGWGIGNNLWLITKDGEEYWKLTDLSPGLGVLHPHFSHGGKKLVWSEIVSGDNRKSAQKGLQGWDVLAFWATRDWALKVGDFVFQDGVPELENIRQYKPQSSVTGLRESHGFSPDEEKIIFSLIHGQSHWWAPDIYTMELSTGYVERLTSTDTYWDEHAHYSPDGKKSCGSLRRELRKNQVILGTNCGL